MVALDLVESELLRLVQGLQADVVVLVEVRLLERLNIAFLVETLEPGSLLRVDHGIFGEHTEESSVDGREPIISQLGVVTGGVLVVEGWEEDRVLLIGGHFVDISEVASWHKPVLDERGVDEFIGYHVNDIASDSIEAVWNFSDTHVWSTESDYVSDLSWHVTLLSNVSGEEATLGKTDDVELTVEGLVSSDLSAGLLGNSLHVADDGSNHWNADLDALDGSSSTLSEHLVELNVSWLEAEVTETVEHGSWDLAGLLWLLNVEGALWVLGLVDLGFDLGFRGEEGHDGALALSFIIILEHEFLGGGLIGNVLVSLLLVPFEPVVGLLALGGLKDFLRIEFDTVLVLELDSSPLGVLMELLERIWDLEMWLGVMGSVGWLELPITMGLLMLLVLLWLLEHTPVVVSLVMSVSSGLLWVVVPVSLRSAKEKG